jgi:5-methylcytosine-specific restriction protein A
MREQWVNLLQSTLSQETGTGIFVAKLDPPPNSRRSSLTARFEDYEPGGGPEFVLKPHAMTGWQIEMKMGSWSRECLDMMRDAGPEQYATARQILATIADKPGTSVVVKGQSLEDWTVPLSGFGIQIQTWTPEAFDGARDDSSIDHAARRFMAPLIAAAAELIGYESETTEAEEGEETFDLEGRLLRNIVKRRERSPRNRMLCLAIYGNRCGVCGVVPDEIFEDVLGLIEVHHIEPVARLTVPRPYNPKTDLIPLCPTCHRAVHKTVPPMLPSELEKRIRLK